MQLKEISQAFLSFLGTGPGWTHEFFTNEEAAGRKHLTTSEGRDRINLGFFYEEFKKYWINRTEYDAAKGSIVTQDVFVRWMKSTIEKEQTAEAGFISKCVLVVGCELTWCCIVIGAIWPWPKLLGHCWLNLCSWPS